MELRRATLGVILALVSCACGRDEPTPPEACTARDYLVSSSVRPFSATYLSHCSGRMLGTVYESSFRSAGGSVYFQGTPDGETFGLWVSDGTAAGTRRLVGSDSYSAGAEVPFIREILPTSGGAFFFMDIRCYFPDPPPSPPATPLWWTRGEDAAELILAGRRVYAAIATATTLFVVASEAEAYSLWAMPLSGRVPLRLAQLPTLARLAPADNGGVVFGSGSQAWFSDGSAAGTYDLGTGCASSAGEVVPAARQVYFVCSGDRLLWASDITTRTTYTVPGAPTGPTAHIVPLASLNGHLLFYHRPGRGRPTELWTSDGTLEGTRPIRDFDLPDHDDLRPPRLEMRGSLYFTVGDVLWRTDGTSGGTLRIAELTPQAAEPDRTYGRRGPRMMVDVGGTLFVLTNDAEVWKVDAAEAERLPLDSRISFISTIAATRTQLLYAARDAELFDRATLRAWGCPEP